MRPIPPHSPSPGTGLVVIVLVMGIFGAFGRDSMGLSSAATGTTGLLMVAVALALVTIIDLRAGLAALVFSVGFSPEFSVGVVPNLRYEDLLMPVLCFGWLSQASRNREPFVPSPVNSPIFAILVVAVLSSLLGVVQGYVEPVFTGFRIGKVIEYFVIFWLFVNVIRSKSDFEGLVLAVLVTGAAASLAAILGAYQGGESGPGRAGGPEGEGSNIFGGYVMIVCALFLGMFIAARNARMRLVYTLGILVTFWAMMLTFSRTSYVALTLGLIFLAILRRRAIIGWVFVLAIVFQVAMPRSIVDRAATILDIFGEKAPSSWNARVVGWQSLSRSIFTDPLLGRGVGVVGLSAADNEYMLQLVQGGVLGLGVFLWMLWRQMRVCSESEQLTHGEPVAEGFSLGASLAILSLSVHGMGATSFTSIRTMEQLMVVLGLVGALHYRYPLWQEEEQKFEERDRIPMRRVIRPVLRPQPRPGL